MTTFFCRAVAETDWRRVAGGALFVAVGGSGSSVTADSAAGSSSVVGSSLDALACVDLGKDMRRPASSGLISYGTSRFSAMNRRVVGVWSSSFISLARMELMTPFSGGS